MIRMSHPNPSNTSRMLSRQLPFQRHAYAEENIPKNNSARGIKNLFASKYSIYSLIHHYGGTLKKVKTEKINSEQLLR